MKGYRAKLTKTEDLPAPNIYAQMLLGEYSHKAFDQERVPEFKGKWHDEVFKKPKDFPIDVEIGTGNGYHFADRSSKNLDRGLVGFEVKYKPLIQTIRRALKAGAEDNAFICRYNAGDLIDLFEPGEIENLYIHHPDPWPRKKHWKHRLIQNQFLKELHTLMKPGRFIEFKTDNLEYFDWSEEIFKNSEFEVTFLTRDLHNSEKAETNFITHFEKIFLAKGQPIYYLTAVKK
jgi:tRNA (guanine-N7-)-methyltransferase